MPVYHPLERFAAVLAAVVCMAISVTIWRSVSGYQSMWPLPALYLVEMVFLAAAAALAVFGAIPARMIVLWAAVGAMAGFCILGAWSVGFLYAPIALILAVLAVASDVRSRQFRLLHLGVCLLAALLQTAIMLAVMRL